MLDNSVSFHMSNTHTHTAHTPSLPPLLLAAPSTWLSTVTRAFVCGVMGVQQLDRASRGFNDHCENAHNVAAYMRSVDEPCALMPRASQRCIAGLGPAHRPVNCSTADLLSTLARRTPTFATGSRTTCGSVCKTSSRQSVGSPSSATSSSKQGNLNRPDIHFLCENPFFLVRTRKETGVALLA